MRPLLLAISELGGYPDFSSLYSRLGYEVLKESSMRKAMSIIRKREPAVIVAEFNFQSDFRDRTSSLESMMSVVQRLEKIHTIIFYDKEYQHQFDRLLQRHPFYQTFTFPIPESGLESCLEKLFQATK
ncbi:MAG: hypothetical protein V3W04_03935 [Gammaproteobacteria bacterium]